MKLQDLIMAVKEQNLTKEQLESYRNDMSSVYAQMQLEMASLEKQEALFMGKLEGSAISRKIAWKTTEAGQRLIVLKRYTLAVKELLNSLKSRLYSIY